MRLSKKLIQIIFIIGQSIDSPLAILSHYEHTGGGNNANGNKFLVIKELWKYKTRIT